MNGFRICLPLLFVAQTFFTNAQSARSTTDSLNHVLSAISSDSAKMNRCIEWSKARQGNDYSTAIEFAEKAIAYAQQLNLPERQAYAINILGNIYWYMSDYDKAMKHYLHAMEIRDEIGDERGSGTSRVNIGSMLIDQGDYPRAKKYFDEAIHIFRKINNTEEETAALLRIGEWYYYQKMYDSSYHYYNIAKEIALNNQYTDLISEANNGLASYLRRNGKPGEALALYEENLKIDQSEGDEYSITVTLNNISLAYAGKGQLDKAISTANESLELALKINNYHSILHALGNLTSFYQEKNDFKNAFKYQNAYLAYKEELNSEENGRITREMEAKFQDEKKEMAIAELKAIEKLQQEEIRRKEIETRNEKNKAIAFGFGFVLVLALAAVVYRSLQQNKKANKIILAQKAEVEEKKHLLEEKNKEILDSISYAKRLQEAILPPLRIVKAYLPDSFILYLPKDIVAGDFYFLENEKDLVFFAAADCTGHGVPGAMVSVVCSNALNRSVKEFGISDPGEILDKVRELVLDTFSRSENEVKDGMDISLCCLNTQTNEVRWAGANNPLWIIRKDEADITEILPDKQPIGAGIRAEPFTSHTIQLQKGDALYLFSDGFADQFGGENGKKFKSSNFKKLLLRIRSLPMNEQKNELQKAFESWRSSLEQLDDVCVIGVKI